MARPCLPRPIRRRFAVLGAVVAFATELSVAGAQLPATASPDPQPYQAGKTTIVAVAASTEASRTRLLAADPDVVNSDARTVDVMLHDAQDAARLRGAGFDWQVVVADVDARNRAARAAEAAKAAAVQADPADASSLPTGRVSYRTLPEVNAEMQELAARYPHLVKLFRLPHKSLLGQTIWGLEVTHDVGVDSGKPVFLMNGLTHSREWPTVELTMEFVWDLVENDGKDPRITSLLDRAELISVPVVNPDGYEMSRNLIQEQKRKNCRVKDGQIPTYAQCADPANFDFGVDLNRNYGPFWGGPGAGADPTSSNYRGGGPTSEPEIQNMTELMASHQITAALSNHTPDARVLRVPSASNEPTPEDATLYQGLATTLGGIMKWPAGPWPDVYYEASGTQEQGAYYSAGTLAFTFENTPGGLGFHPPYQYVIDQYNGTGAYPGSDAREAFLTLFEAAANPAYHAIITGTARPGTTLEISKDETLYTSAVSKPDWGPGMVQRPVQLHLESTMTVPRDGHFTWNVEPSLRPSQTFSAHIQESWTLTCGNPHDRHRPGVTVSVGRGDTAQVDLRRCGR